MVASGTRPPRDPRIQAIAAALPPPPHHVSTLAQPLWLDAAAALWRASREAIPEGPPPAAWLPFFLHTHAAALDPAIPVTLDQLLWLAAPGDAVLLSDGATHHASSIASLDAAAGTVTLHGNPARTLSAAEFASRLIAVATLDTPALLERFLDAHPAARGNHRLPLAFGNALMCCQRDSLAPAAAAWFDQSLFAALLATSDEREHIAAQLYCALTIAMHRARPQPETLAAKPFADRLYRLMLDHTEAALQRRLSAAQLLRMAASAAWSREFVRADQLFSLVLHREPAHPHALQLRAAAAFHKRCYDEAIEDSLQGLESASHAYAAALNQRPPEDAAPALLAELAAARLNAAAAQLASLYGVLTAACIAASRWYEAKRHALAWQSLSPADSAPLAILARVEEQAGNAAAARSLYLRAAAAEPDPARKSGFESLAADLAPPGPSA